MLTVMHMYDGGWNVIFLPIGKFLLEGYTSFSYITSTRISQVKTDPFYFRQLYTCKLSKNLLLTRNKTVKISKNSFSF